MKLKKRNVIPTLAAALMISASCEGKRNGAAQHDDRIAIELTAQQRNYFLAEMREMMFSLNGTLAGVSSGQLSFAAESARKSGAAFLSEAGDIPTDLNEKLPAEFRNFRSATHRNFDELAALIEQKRPLQEIVGMLTNITGNCAACHAMFRIEIK